MISFRSCHQKCSIKKGCKIFKNTYSEEHLPSTASAASLSKAGFQRISAEEILKRWSWSSESTWQKFYNKEIVPKETVSSKVS